LYFLYERGLNGRARTILIGDFPEETDETFKELQLI